MKPASTDTKDLSHEARNLQWLLSNFVEEVPGVRSVAVVSSDGLLLLSSESAPATSSAPATATASSSEPESGPGRASRFRPSTATPTPAPTPAGPAGSQADLATVVSGLASLTHGAAQLMDGGRVRQTAVAMDEGSLFVMSISDGSLLGVHAAADCDMSVVGYHMALFVGRAGHVLTPALRRELRKAMEDGR